MLTKAMFSLKNASFILSIFVSVMLNIAASENFESDSIINQDLEDAELNFTELAVKYGGECEEHQVTTVDGYILTVFRMPNPKARPVILQHGNLGSADDYVVRGSTSMAVALYEADYDVWVMNVRGNKYSRGHVSLDPEVDEQFWDYSLQEVAVCDTTAAIDYILAKTNQSQLAAIGYSVGTSVFYVLGAEKPEYNKKISVMISLAPICYAMNSVPLAGHHMFGLLLNNFLETMGINEFNGKTLGSQYMQEACIQVLASLGTTLATAVCLKIFMSFTPGFDVDELEPQFSPILMSHYPTSISRKFMMNFAQNGYYRRFAQYDYGTKGNLEKYGSVLPPSYDLSLTDMPIVLISGKDDQISTLADVELLKPLLPNLIDHIILEPENFNHADFMWARHLPEILYPPIFNLLEIYT